MTSCDYLARKLQKLLEKGVFTLKEEKSKRKNKSKISLKDLWESFEDLKQTGNLLSSVSGGSAFDTIRSLTFAGLLDDGR